MRSPIGGLFLTKSPRAKAVLELAAEKGRAGDNRCLKGSARSVSLRFVFGTHIWQQVAEVGGGRRTARFVSAVSSARRSAPAIEVHIVQEFQEPPGGMGEGETLGDRLRAICINAIFAATGLHA